LRKILPESEFEPGTSCLSGAGVFTNSTEACDNIYCNNQYTGFTKSVETPKYNFCKNENIKKRQNTFDLSKKLPFDMDIDHPLPPRHGGIKGC